MRLRSAVLGALWLAAAPLGPGCATPAPPGGSAHAGAPIGRAAERSSGGPDCFGVGTRVSAIDATGTSFTGVGQVPPTWGPTQSTVRQPYVMRLQGAPLPAGAEAPQCRIALPPGAASTAAAPPAPDRTASVPFPPPAHP